METKHRSSSKSQTKRSSGNSPKPKLVVISDYEKSDNIESDNIELSVKKGDVILLIGADEDGWIEARNEITGEQGKDHHMGYIF